MSISGYRKPTPSSVSHSKQPTSSASASRTSNASSRTSPPHLPHGVWVCERTHHRPRPGDSPHPPPPPPNHYGRNRDWPHLRLSPNARFNFNRSLGRNGGVSSAENLFPLCGLCTKAKRSCICSRLGFLCWCDFHFSHHEL